MRGVTVAITVGCLLFFIIPVAAINEDKYGYITIKDMNITLEQGKAYIDISYTLDEPTRLIVLLLGKQDLKNRLLRILNYEDAEFVHIGMDRARLIVKDVSYNYGRGVYWFPAHRFNIMIPSLRVVTPQTSRVFQSTREIPNGIGYFDNPG
jgi:hypothetical protein